MTRGVPYVSYSREFRPRRGSVPQAHQAYPFPAPMGGVDVQQNLVGGNPLTAIRLENLLPNIQGVSLRKGYTLWQGSMPAITKTILPYVSPPAGTPNATFAAGVDGSIYDITAQNQIPPLLPVHTVLSQADPGNFIFINFTNIAGSFLLAVGGEGGGYLIFDGTTWVTVTMGAGPNQIQGVDPLDFKYIWTWGNRVWFVQRDSLDAWYLPVGQITGLATKFPLGGVMPHGGKLYAGANWTVDGGGGDSGSTTSMSDKNVFFTDQGDVAIYGGSDPSTAATFAIQGRWFVGRIPKGGRAIKRYGSDVLILSERGMVMLSELLRGQGFFQTAETARNINPILAKDITANLDAEYWEAMFLPREEAIIINYPLRAGQPDQQWLYMINAKAFTLLKGMDMLTVSVVEGRTFFADNEDKIWWAFQGGSDGEDGSVDPPVRGKDIEGLMLSSFQPMGDGIRQKRLLMCKTQWFAQSAPGVMQELRGNFNAIDITAPVFTLSGESLWDTAIWDASFWAGEQTGYTHWRGADGVGYYVAMALKVKGVPDTTLVNWAAVVENGGLLGA